MSGKYDVVELTLYDKQAIFSNGTSTSDEVFVIRNPDNS